MSGKWPDKIRGIRIDHEGRQFKIGRLRDGIIFLEVGAGWHVSILIKERRGTLHIQPHITNEKPKRRYKYGPSLQISRREQKRLRKLLKKLTRQGRRVLRNVTLKELEGCTLEWLLDLEKVKEFEFTVRKGEVYLGNIISDPPIRPHLIKSPMPLASIELVENGLGVIKCGVEPRVDGLVVKLRGSLGVFDLQKFMDILDEILDIIKEFKVNNGMNKQARRQ